jgi:hypothetical protein
VELPKATVEPGADGKSFRLLLDGREIGVSKAQFDADFHKNLINDAILAAYNIGRGGFYS